MKKFMTLTMTALMLVSLSACNARNYGQRNESVRNINYGTSQGNYQGQSTARRMSINQNAPQVMTGEYRDGTFTGIGNRTAYGYESATVDIRSGRIVNVTLRRMDASGREISYDVNTGNAIVNRTGTASGTNITGYGGNYGAIIPGTIGIRTGYGVDTTRTGYSIGNIGFSNRYTDGITTVRYRNSGPYSYLEGNDLEDYGGGHAIKIGNVAGLPGGGTYWGYSSNLASYNLPSQYRTGTTGIGTGTTGIGTGTGYNGTTRTGMTGNTGNTGTGAGYTGGGTVGSTTPNMMDSRTRLANLIIQAQTSNVNTDALGNSDTVISWKLAVQRALDEARK